jgi:ribitol-5-phosphate 2-dehydrogenase (NADP+) / D-ribitol-5-phosphate cytidylyltransferase
MQIHAIVLAGGNGHRFGAEMPKQFVRLAGEPILLRSIRGIAAAGVDRIVVVAQPSWLKETRAVVDSAELTVPVQVVPGGATRNESTANGLRSLHAADDDIVVVHDAVRPLCPVDVVLRSIEPILLGRADGTDTVIPSADTLVVVDEDGDDVLEIPDRSRFRRGQTPQTFRKSVLAAAYDAAARAGDLSATDDCSLVLRHVPGARIVAVAGDEMNIKITTRVDMVVADRMLQMQTMSPLDGSAASRPIRGARIVVVGGTNGIGQAIAQQAERLGASVVVDGRSLGLDVRDADAVQERIDAAAERLGGIDHVVSTAGVLTIGALTDTAPDQVAEVIDVNLTGNLNVARAAYRHLRASHGSLTVFASSSFTRGRPGYVAYSASKAAVVNLAQGLAEEWATDGIRVNAVSPERTDTPMRRRAFPNEAHDALLSAAEVANATLSLLQCDLTGQVLDVRRHDAICASPGDAERTRVPEPGAARVERRRRQPAAAQAARWSGRADRRATTYAQPGAAGE